MNCMIIKHVITNITTEPFSNPHIKRLMNKYLRKITQKMLPRQPLGIDPFSRECITSNAGAWGHWIISNDLNKSMPTDFHMEANKFAKAFNEKDGRDVDLIFFDPPYTLRLLKDHYMDENCDIENTIPLWQTNNMWGECKDHLAAACKVGGYAISFGYHTHGMGKHRGFEKREILICEQAGSPDRYDLLVTVEQKVQTSLKDIPNYYYDNEE